MDFENTINELAIAVPHAIREPRSGTDILAQPGFSMTEGWFGDDYLILFDEAEVASASDRYSISRVG